MLRRSGTPIGRRRVMRLMRENSLFARRKRRFSITTKANPNKAPAPNILNRNFFPDSPNEIWWGDITEIKTHEGPIYLATMIDEFSRQIVGYSCDDNREQKLALEALRMARIYRNSPH